MMTEAIEPLIWTTHGNLPQSSLEYRTRWEFPPGAVTFVETYLLEGEVVRESVHVHALNQGS